MRKIDLDSALTMSDLALASITEYYLVDCFDENSALEPRSLGTGILPRSGECRSANHALPGLERRFCRMKRPARFAFDPVRTFRDRFQSRRAHLLRIFGFRNVVVPLASHLTLRQHGFQISPI